MSAASPNPSPLIVVTGANGLVGSRICAVLSDRGARVRAVVRREGTAPALPGVGEEVGDFTDPGFAATVALGADAIVTTVHPMGSDLATQRRIGVEGTATLAAAARDAGVARLVHVSTAAVYDRAPGAGDADEASPLVGEDGGDYAVTKRDADAALADIDGFTRVLVRPPAILGAGETSVWNTLRPETMRTQEWARHAIPEKSFTWVHVDDLASFIADLATEKILTHEDPAFGPIEGGCTPVNLSAGAAPMSDYLHAVTEPLGIEPVWDMGESWTGDILSTRAHAWGWSPLVDAETAFAELSAGLRSEQG